MGVIDRLRGVERPRVVVLGMDGVPYSLLTEHPARFEHLTSLIEDGSATSIDGVIPPESSASWPSLTTGMNPGETGVYGLLDRELDTYQTYITESGDVQVPHVWDYVTQAERQATVINVPVTHPPQRNLQRMVAGFLAPDIERAVYPRSLASILESLDYRIDVDATLARDGNMRGFLENAYETIDARFEAFAHFLDMQDWDLFFGVFMTPDRVNHFLYGDYLDGGPFREDFLSFYEQLDTYIGALRSRLPADTVLLVVSNHGFSSLTHEVQTNRWLRESGWLTYQTESPTDLTDIGDQTQAYALPPGRFYLNLADREPRGTVAEHEYELVRDRLREALLDWTGPNGEQVIDSVVTRERVYRGRHVDLAPDLVAIPAAGFELQASFKGDGPTFMTSNRTGMHKLQDACLLIDRPDIDLSQATIFDVAPTILSMLGIEFERGEFDGVRLL